MEIDVDAVLDVMVNKLGKSEKENSILSVQNVMLTRQVQQLESTLAELQNDSQDKQDGDAS